MTCQRLKNPSPSATPHCRQTERMEIFKSADSIFSCILHNDSNTVQKNEQDALSTHYITTQTVINTAHIHSTMKTTAHEQTLNELGNYYTIHKSQ